MKEPPKCPLGTVGTPPNCKRIVIEKIPKKGGDATKQRKCPPGTFGPNCTKLIFKKKSAPSPGQVPR